MDSPLAALATWVTAPEGLEKFAAGAKPVTDDRPLIEYGDWVRPNEITRALPQLLGLKVLELLPAERKPARVKEMDAQFNKRKEHNQVEWRHRMAPI